MTLREKVLMVKAKPKEISLPDFYKQNQKAYSSIAEVRRCSQIVSKIKSMEDCGNISGVERVLCMCDNDPITAVLIKLSKIDPANFVGGQTLEEMISQIKGNKVTISDDVIADTINAALINCADSIRTSGIFDTKIKMDTTQLDLMIQLLQVVKNTNIITG